MTLSEWNRTLLEERVTAIGKLMDDTMETLEAKRKAEAKAQITMEKAKFALGDATRAAIYEAWGREEVSRMQDPDQQKMVVDYLAGTNEAVQKAAAGLNDAKGEYLMNQVDSLTLSERMGTLRVRATLLSAMLHYLAATGDTG